VNTETETTALNSLLRGLAVGEERAYRSLYDRMGARLYRTALGLLGRHEDAEDAVQDLFLSLVRSRRKLSAVNDLTPYLFTALRHAAGRCLARRRREPAASESATRGELPYGSAKEKTSDRARQLDAARHALPREQQEVLTLKIEGELTFAQIGNVLGVPPSTAASRYRYALEKLHAALKRPEP
jgi:RNA polymerase sigma-70 factor (ECF subfamily)